MPAGSPNLSPNPTASSKPARDRASPHQSPRVAHRDHDVFLRREILHQKMKLKNEADEFVALMRKLVIGQIRDRFRFDRNPADIGLIEQTENVEQRAFAAAGGTDNSVDATGLEIERDARSA